MSAYFLRDADEFYAEFIAPLTGSGYSRKGEPEFVAETAGVTAQRLRWIELLLLEPWTTSVRGADVRVANPVAYIAQKLLAIPRRALTMRDQQAKDLLYVQDTLVLFQEHLEDLRGVGDHVLRARIPAHEKQLHEYRTGLFGPGLCAGAAKVAEKSGRPSPPTAQQLTRVCRAGLEILFGRE